MTEKVVIQELLTVHGTVFALRKMNEQEAGADSLAASALQESRTVRKEKVKVGDFVIWDNVGGPARGRVLNIMRSGTLNVPDSSFKIKAEEDDPAVLIRLYRKEKEGYKAQDVRVGHKMSELRRIESLEKGERDQNKPPAAVQAAGKKAVGWIKEGLNGDGFTSVGRRRASQLANGENVSERDVRRMANYFTRHEKDKQAEGFSVGEKGYPRPGRVAWEAWGGDAGKSWAQGLVDKWDKADMEKADVEKRFTLGPWYVPNSLDAHSEWTDEEELQKALWDYVKSGNRQIRLQHVPETVAGHWVEAMTMPFEVEVPMQNLAEGTVVKRKFPEGTVFMGVQWEPWAWELVKQGAIRGFSIGGKAARKEEDLYAVLDKAACAESVVKGDKPGHAFRGNQWTRGGGGGGGGGVKQDDDAKAEAEAQAMAEDQGDAPEGTVGAQEGFDELYDIHGEAEQDVQDLLTDEDFMSTLDEEAAQDLRDAAEVLESATEDLDEIDVLDEKRVRLNNVYFRNVERQLEDAADKLRETRIPELEEIGDSIVERLEDLGDIDAAYP